RTGLGDFPAGLVRVRVAVRFVVWVVRALLAMPARLLPSSLTWLSCWFVAASSSFALTRLRQHAPNLRDERVRQTGFGDKGVAPCLAPTLCEPAHSIHGAGAH